jgi:hypothetical protein
MEFEPTLPWMLTSCIEPTPVHCQTTTKQEKEEMNDFYLTSLWHACAAGVR